MFVISVCCHDINFKMSRPTLEGSLTKWTNVMKGWQHRWFVLDENSGILSYYTSREKMTRGVRRGCVRLKGAILGIDHEEDGNFTITTDSKTFHFQARDAIEREVWVRALEDTILRHAPFPHTLPVQPIVVLRKHMPHHLLKVHFEADEASHENNMKRFDSRIAQTDALLQMLIDQSAKLENRAAGLEDVELKMRLERIAKNYKQMLDAVKLAIVLLQILKNTIDPVHGIGLVTKPAKPRFNSRASSSQFYAVRPELEDVAESPVPSSSNNGVSVEVAAECQEGRHRPGIIDVSRGEGMTLIVPPEIVPETSYSSSDDEDFFDAEELHSPVPRPETPVFVNLSGGSKLLLPRKGSDASETASKKPKEKTPPKNNDGTLDYDALYEEDNSQDDISMENHGSLITHLLSQVKIGMDLTKVVLPTFILETRSLLEMYADYFAHPDIFISIADGQTARDRMIRVVRWYVSAYHAGRKSGVAKKPYNPILGEVFQCHWEVPGEQPATDPVADGPVPWCTSDQLTFIAEQVSHHPPVSAFYAEHFGKKISFNAFVYTKSKFLGLSVGVHNVGHGIVSVLEHDEEYKVTFPSGYGRSILTVPWIELGGSVAITCEKTGYHAKVEFMMKPFYGGKRHQICAEIFAPGEKKPFQTINGEWNGAMHVSYAKTGRSELFVDVNQIPPVKKLVRKIADQQENESRRLWKEVTAGLRLNDIDKATNSKTTLEQKQRDEAKQRKDQTSEWETKLFSDMNGEWFFKYPLSERLKRNSS